MRARRDATDPAFGTAASAAITAQALALPAYAQAATVHLFLSFQSEVDTSAIAADALARGKRVLVPAFPEGADSMRCTQITTLDAAAFDVGVWGTRTPKHFMPVPPEDIDLIFVPLSAFARGPDGVHRLGYGRGHYDRFLPQLRADVLKIGLAFRLQEEPVLPLEPHDIMLDTVLTE